MATSKPIVGLDLNLDDDYLAECVKQTVIAGISESLNGKNEIVSHLVNAVLTQKVDEHGKVSSWAFDNKQTLLEYYVNKAIKEAAKEEIAVAIDAARPAIAKAMRRELGKAQTIDKLVASFADDMVNSCTSNWRAKLGITFEQAD